MSYSSPDSVKGDDSPMSVAAGAVRAMEAISRDLENGAFPTRKDVDNALAEGGIQDPNVRSFVSTNLVPQTTSVTTNGRTPGKGSWRWRCDIAAIAKAMKGLTSFDTKVSPGSQFHGPTLFIAGRRSPYVQEAHRSRILDLFPAAEVRYMENCGHWLQAEDPKGFCELLTPFIEAQ